MKLILKITIFLSAMFMVAGLYGEELIASFYDGYSKYNKETVDKMYQSLSAGETDPEKLMKALEHNLDSQDFYLQVKDRAKSMSFFGVVLFLFSFSLLEFIDHLYLFKTS